MDQNESSNSANFGSNSAENVASPLAEAVDQSGSNISDVYKLLEKIGEGAGSVVYKAEHLILNQPVAVKILKKDLFTNQNAVERFKREAKLSTRLEHPHIVRVTGFGISRDNDPFIVMHYIDGITLEKRLERGPLGLDESIELATQILDALAYAHDLGIVHRDIKPANILLSKDTGTEKIFAMLLDFGLAKDLSLNQSEKPNLTQTAFMLGTPNYMSPEQCLMQAVDLRTDIYSFACVLYECLTGRMPFQGETDLLVMDMHLRLHASFKPNDKLSRELQDVILKCLIKDPDRRYKNAREFSADMLAASKLSSSQPTFVVKHAILVGAFAVIIAVLVVWLLFKPEAPKQANSSDNPGLSSTPHKLMRKTDLSRMDANWLRDAAGNSLRGSKALKPDRDEAIRLFSLAQKKYLIDHDQVSAALCLMEIASVYVEKSDYQAAIPLLLQVAHEMEGFAKPSDAVADVCKYNAADAYFRLADLYFRKSETKKAIAYYEKALALCPVDNSLRFKIRADEAGVYLHENDYENASLLIKINRKELESSGDLDLLAQQMKTKTELLDLKIALSKHSYDVVRKKMPVVVELNLRLSNPLSWDLTDVAQEALRLKQYAIAVELAEGVTKSQEDTDSPYRKSAEETLISAKKLLK